jgi:hypothetical protein
MENLGSGKKKIFVAGPYAASQLTSDSVANNLCGSGYKALVYLGGELPTNKLPADNEFWNCQQVTTGSSQCKCERVATHKLDLFTDKGGGVYLLSPITGTKTGAKMTNVRVWTNFKPNGSGGTIQLSTSTFGSLGSCVSSYQPCYYKGYYNGSCYYYYCQTCNSGGSCGTGCQLSRRWAGNTSATDIKWAFVDESAKTALNNDCRSLPYSHAIYCVQQ